MFMCMYVCIHACMYVCMYVRKYLYMNYAHTRMCIYTCIKLICSATVRRKVKRQTMNVYVTLRCVSTTTDAVEMQYYICWVNVCGLNYPERKAHASKCHLWTVRIHNIFPHYLTNGTIFEKKKMLLNIKCVLIFSTILVWRISYSTNN